MSRNPYTRVGKAVAPSTWETRVTSGLSLGAETRFTNIGPAPGMRAGWDGSRWRPANGVALLAQSAVPIILSSSASAITATGAVTGATALSYTPSGVVQVYMALGSSGGINGLYFARYSSTTAFQLYTDAAGTVTPTGLTAGAYTASTSLVTLYSQTIKGGLMGPNGGLRIASSIGLANTANSKTIRWTLGSSIAWGSSGSLTNSATLDTTKSVRNRGSQSSQTTHGSFLAGNSTGIVLGAISEDTSVDIDLSFRAQLIVATDFILLDAYAIELIA